MPKTRYPGVRKLKDGRYEIRSARRHPTSGKIVSRLQKLEHGTSIEEAATLRMELDKELLAELQDEVQASPAGLVGVADPRGTTLSAFAEQWLKLKTRRYKPSMIDRVTGTLSDWVLPQLGHLKIEEITRPVIREWVAWAESQTPASMEALREPDPRKRRKRSDKPYARATLAGVWRIAKQIIGEAAADADLRDPTWRVTGPTSRRRATREQATLTKAQLDQLLEASERVPEWHAEVLTLCRTGMRPSELYGLQWSDLNREKKILTIQRSVVRGEVGSTKTDAERHVPVDDLVVEAWEKHRKLLIASEHAGAWGDIVFPSDYGTHRTSAPLREHLHRLAKVAGITEIKVSPQVIRRSLNTLWIQAGIPEPVVRAIMGHSSKQMTQLYAGIQESAKHDALAVLTA